MLQKTTKYYKVSEIDYDLGGIVFLSDNSLKSSTSVTLLD